MVERFAGDEPRVVATGVVEVIVTSVAGAWQHKWLRSGLPSHGLLVGE